MLRNLAGTALLLFLAGCASGPLTTREKGVLGGAALGATTGAIFGGGKGAAIGGAAGAVGGAVAGEVLQRRNQAQQNEEAGYSGY